MTPDDESRFIFEEQLDDLAGISRLLQAASRQRPVDLLIERLSTSTGRSWFDELLQTKLLSTALRLDSENLSLKSEEGSLTLKQLKTLKNEGRERFHSPNAEVKLSGIAGYFLAIAVALVQFDELITSQTAGDVEAVLRDLVEKMDGVWKELFSRAIQQCKDHGCNRSS